MLGLIHLMMAKAECVSTRQPWLNCTFGSKTTDCSIVSMCQLAIKVTINHSQTRARANRQTLDQNNPRSQDLKANMPTISLLCPRLFGPMCVCVLVRLLCVWPEQEKSHILTRESWHSFWRSQVKFNPQAQTRWWSESRPKLECVSSIVCFGYDAYKTYCIMLYTAVRSPSAFNLYALSVV